MTRCRAYEASAEISDAKTLGTWPSSWPSMGSGFVRNLRMCMKGSEVVHIDDDMARESIGAADFR